MLHSRDAGSDAVCVSHVRLRLPPHVRPRPFAVQRPLRCTTHPPARQTQRGRRPQPSTATNAAIDELPCYWIEEPRTTPRARPAAFMEANDAADPRRSRPSGYPPSARMATNDSPRVSTRTPPRSHPATFFGTGAIGGDPSLPKPQLQTAGAAGMASVATDIRLRPPADPGSTSRADADSTSGHAVPGRHAGTFARVRRSSSNLRCKRSRILHVKTSRGTKARPSRGRPRADLESMGTYAPGIPSNTNDLAGSPAT